MTPTTGIPKRIATLFHRRPTTPWSPKEIAAYKQLVKDVPIPTFEDDLELVERYYKAEREKGSAGVHRRDLATFLNNFRGELDRATLWARQRSARGKGFCGFKKTKEVGARVSDEEFKRIGGLARQQLEEFKKQLTHC